MKDHYDVLGISSSATQEEIKKAYREKVRFWHPDRNKSEEAHERIVEINRAYEVLSNPEERRYYDFYRAGASHNSSEHNYTNYEPPPYQPKRGTYKQERRFSANWGRVAFLLIWVIFFFLRNYEDNNIPISNESINFVVKNPIQYNFNKKELTNKIKLRKIVLSTRKKTPSPTITYEYVGDSLFIFDSDISTITNTFYDSSIRREDLNAIIIYQLIPSGKKKNSGVKYDTKLYFIDPITYHVFKIVKAPNNSKNTKPSQINIVNAILKNVSLQHSLNN